LNRPFIIRLSRRVKKIKEDPDKGSSAVFPAFPHVASEKKNN
jgi:hypothetical protein